MTADGQGLEGQRPALGAAPFNSTPTLAFSLTSVPTFSSAGDVAVTSLLRAALPAGGTSLQPSWRKL